MHSLLFFLLPIIINASAIVTTTSDGVVRTIDYRIRAPRIRPTNGFEISHGVLESEDISTSSESSEFGIVATIAPQAVTSTSSDPSVVTTTSDGEVRTIDYRIRAPRIRPTNGFEISQGILDADPTTPPPTENTTTTVDGVVRVIDYNIRAPDYNTIGAEQDRFVTSFI